MSIFEHLMPSQTIRPNPVMVEKLKSYDTKLDAFMNVVNDRWTIVRYVPMMKYMGTLRNMALFLLVDVPWPVLCLQDFEGGYMPLDERALVLLWEGDLQNIDDLDKHYDRVDDKILSVREKMEQDFADDVRHATLENKRQLMRAFEPFDRDNWTESTLPPVPMSHKPVEVDLDVTF